MNRIPTLKASFAALLALALALALALGFGLAGARTSRADDAPKKDEALDRLLEKLEETAPTHEAKPAPDPGKDDRKAGDKPAGDEKARGGKTGDEKKAEASKPADDARPSAEKKAGEVAPQDAALDSLLEKLGETRDTPDTLDERRGGRPMPGEGEGEGGEGKKEGDEAHPPAPDRPGPDELTGKDKSIDERLEELTGRKRKKKQEEEEEGSGPLSQVIKEMREVEQRLGKPDTGEETRKKQTEIVRNLDQLIEQLRNSSSQMKGQKRTKLVNMPGQQPGSKPGQQPGANPGGAPNTKPSKPENKHAFAGGKDEWGHLPPELRQEIDNIAREVMLPSKEELIRLYYLSVSKKSLAREE